MAPNSMPRSEDTSEGRVLIVDDNRDLGDLYNAALRLAQMEVQVAHNAADGWMAAITTQPDVILLDIDLGQGGNGLELLDRLRAHRWPGSAPQVAMFTSSNHPKHRARAAAAGANAYWVKASMRLPQFIAAVKDLLAAQDLGPARVPGAGRVRG